MWLFSSRQARPSRPSRRVPPPRKPQLEALEDRCLLSAGALDPTFGNGAGYVTTAPSKYYDGAGPSPSQRAGTLLAVGRFQAEEPGAKKRTTTTPSVFGVARYNTDGSLDAQFGNGGIAQANFGPNSAYAQSAALQPDGKIVLE